MVKKTFNGEEPVNARIKIDYTGKKPKVKFEYPDKKNQFHGSMFWVIMMFWVIIFGIVFGLPSIFQNVYNQASYYFYPNPVYDKCYDELTSSYNNIRYSVCSMYAKNTSLYYPPYNMFYYIFGVNAPNTSLLTLTKLGSLKLSLEFLGIFGMPYLIYFPFRKKWNKLYPKWMALCQRKKYMIFDSKSELKEGRYFEVPYFNNTCLSYNATGEFSGLLEKFEIIEYPFVTLKKKKGRLIKDKNEWIWYARFYYSKKPRIGKLEVEFK